MRDATALVDVRSILPDEDLEAMGRRRYQCPDVLKTKGKRPQWYIRYYVDVLIAPGETGKERLRRYLGAVKDIGKREAEKLRDEFMRTVNRPDVVIPSQVLFSHVIKAYREAFMPGLKPNSQDVYESAITRHIEPYFGKMRLCDVRKETVQAWVHTKSYLSPNRRRGLLGVLASIWERATEWEYTQQRNPAQGIKIGDDGGGRRKDTRALTFEEFRRLIGAVEINPEWRELRMAAPIAAYSGLRIGEIRGLTWGDVQPGVLLIRRAKAHRVDILTDPKSTKGKRVVPLPDGILIRPVAATDDTPIFEKSYRTLHYDLEVAGASVGIKFKGFGFHTLRHCYATWMDAEGDPLQQTMGHASSAMSQAYVTRTIAQTAARQRRMIERIIGTGTVGRG